MDKLRASVRPVITYLFTVLVLVMFYQGKPIPSLLQMTWLAIIAEWFGERLLFKLMANGK